MENIFPLRATCLPLKIKRYALHFRCTKFVIGRHLFRLKFEPHRWGFRCARTISFLTGFSVPAAVTRHFQSERSIDERKGTLGAGGGGPCRGVDPLAINSAELAVPIFILPYISPTPKGATMKVLVRI